MEVWQGKMQHLRGPRGGPMEEKREAPREERGRSLPMRRRDSSSQDFRSHMEKSGALQPSDRVWHLLPVPGLLPHRDLGVWRKRHLPKLQSIPGAAPTTAAASTSTQSPARARKAGRAQQDRGGSCPKLLPSKAPFPRGLQQEQEPSSGFLSRAAPPSSPLFALSLTGARCWHCPSPGQCRRAGGVGCVFLSLPSEISNYQPLSV